MSMAFPKDIVYRDTIRLVADDTDAMIAEVQQDLYCQVNVV
jgi:hypothetical protein